MSEEGKKNLNPDDNLPIYLFEDELPRINHDELEESDFDLELPEFEIGAIVSLTLDELKRLKDALIKTDDADLECLRLAYKLQLSIESFPIY